MFVLSSNLIRYSIEIKLEINKKNFDFLISYIKSLPHKVTSCIYLLN